MIEIITPDFIYEDDRGRLVQLVHEGWQQVNIISSKADMVRGGHYHKQNRELFFIVDGKCRVRVRKGKKAEEYQFSKGDMFVISEYVAHDFIYEKDTVLVSMYSKGVELDNGGKDIYHDREDKENEYDSIAKERSW